MMEGKHKIGLVSSLLSGIMQVKTCSILAAAMAYQDVVILHQLLQLGRLRLTGSSWCGGSRCSIIRNLAAGLPQAPPRHAVQCCASTGVCQSPVAQSAIQHEANMIDSFVNGAAVDIHICQLQSFAMKTFSESTAAWFTLKEGSCWTGNVPKKHGSGGSPT